MIDKHIDKTESRLLKTKNLKPILLYIIHYTLYLSNLYL